MDEEITISIGPKERIIIDEILKSSLLGISTTEEALLWSLGVAKMFFISLDPSTKDSDSFSPVGIRSVFTPIIEGMPYSVTGIKPVIAVEAVRPFSIPPAPESMVDTFSTLGIEPVPTPGRTIRIHLEESEVERKSIASDIDLPNLDSG